MSYGIPTARYPDICFSIQPTRSWGVGSQSAHKVLILIYIYLAVIINHAARKTDVCQAGNACRLEGFDVIFAVVGRAGADGWRKKNIVSLILGFCNARERAVIEMYGVIAVTNARSRRKRNALFARMESPIAESVDSSMNIFAISTHPPLLRRLRSMRC